jgi:hypothetical protein
MRRSILIALAASSLALGGCATTKTSSSDKFKGEEKAVADVVSSLQSAGERKDAGKICDEILAPSLSAQIKAAGSTCADEIHKAIDDADDFDLTVLDVTITGGSAKATVRGGGDKGPRTVFQFAKEGGKWKATSLPAG